jgi:hypothetical protein
MVSGIFCPYYDANKGSKTILDLIENSSRFVQVFRIQYFLSAFIKVAIFIREVSKHLRSTAKFHAHKTFHYEKKADERGSSLRRLSLLRRMQIRDLNHFRFDQKSSRYVQVYVRRRVLRMCFISLGVLS